ncbi:hypothetical protein H0194_01935 [Corynebacterium incognita]|uniref:Secreted protein n=1 Tax=Corynebacterium incognita TaxID=2754725 RepID=A0A7G7CQH0_9CORY|nr:hypothetical protein [Corynebacterium incognita]QNE89836.1 hypothetical protein H0194_01935 [Corynebacterium incognita]
MRRRLPLALVAATATVTGLVTPVAANAVDLSSGSSKTTTATPTTTAPADPAEEEEKEDEHWNDKLPDHLKSSQSTVDGIDIAGAVLAAVAALMQVAVIAVKAFPPLQKMLKNALGGRR